MVGPELIAATMVKEVVRYGVDRGMEYMERRLGGARTGEWSQLPEDPHSAVTPNTVDGHHRRALGFAERHRPVEAEEHFVRAIELDPNDPWVRLSYALFLADEGGPEEAEAHFLRVLDAGDADEVAHFTYALFLDEQHGGRRQRNTTSGASI